jgi:hypothetical protein
VRTQNLKMIVSDRSALRNIRISLGVPAITFTYQVPICQLFRSSKMAIPMRLRESLPNPCRSRAIACAQVANISNYLSLRQIGKYQSRPRPGSAMNCSDANNNPISGLETPFI